uniref:Uncharacterized protein n=1 Tax=Rhizophora mucronata TaxID=61149 RepID=A0A2P2PLT7_RHIMU
MLCNFAGLDCRRVDTSFLEINKYIKGFNVGGTDCKTMYVWSSITNCQDSLIRQEFLNWSCCDIFVYGA